MIHCWFAIHGQHKIKNNDSNEGEQCSTQNVLQFLGVEIWGGRCRGRQGLVVALESVEKGGVRAGKKQDASCEPGGCGCARLKHAVWC